jgi:hypothetical protein
VSGEKIEADIYPGSLVEFRLDVENIYSSDSDIDIDNVDATVTIEDLNDDEDVEEDSRDYDLKPGEEADIIVLIRIPTKVENKEYPVEIKVEGDGNVTERILINLTLVVKKDSHDLRLISYSVTPLVVICDRQISVHATLANLGSREETDAALEFISDELGLSRKKGNIGLSDDPFDDESELSWTVPYTIPGSIPAGTYSIDIRALFQNELAMDTRTVSVAVKDCPSSQPAAPIETQKPAEPIQESAQQEPQMKNDTQETPVLVQGEGTVPEARIEAQKEQETSGSSVERPFLSTPFGIGALLLGNLLILVIFIYVGAGIFAKGPRKGEGDGPDTQ